MISMEKGILKVFEGGNTKLKEPEEKRRKFHSQKQNLFSLSLHLLLYPSFNGFDLLKGRKINSVGGWKKCIFFRPFCCSKWMNTNHDFFHLSSSNDILSAFCWSVNLYTILYLLT